MEKTGIRPNHLRTAVISLLLLIIYSPTISWMMDRWNAHDSYYSHGFLVPLVSLYILWIKRAKLSKMKLKPATWGVWLILGGLIVHLLSALLRVYLRRPFP